jgi:hypothetical protein
MWAKVFVMLEAQQKLIFEQQHQLTRLMDRILEPSSIINFVIVEKGDARIMTEESKPSISVHGPVGALVSGGTAIIGTINQTIGELLDKPETQSVGTALKALFTAIEAEKNIDEPLKIELLEHLDEISTKAAQPPETIKKSTMKSIVDSFANLCAGAGGLAVVWQTWGPALRGFFGL